MIQYNSAIAITGAIRGTSKEKLYQELGFESLQQRLWYRKLCYLYKISKEQSPSYLFRLPPNQNTRYAKRSSKGIPQYRTNHENFKSSFFPATIKEWNMLIPIVEALKALMSSKTKFIRPKAKTFFNCLNTKEVKLLTRWQLGLNHFRGHKFKYSFQDCLSPTCTCGTDAE